MRTNTYAGLSLGARVIEMRRGTVAIVEVGTVYWPTPEEAAISGILYRFTPQTKITGKKAHTVAAELHAIRVASYDKFTARYGDNRAKYDALLAAAA